MKKSMIPRNIALLAALAAIVTFFLPYISSTDDFRTYISAHADEKVFSSVDITVGDMGDMSLYTYGRIYFLGGEEILRSRDSGIFYGVLLFSVAGFALLTAFAALGKKPVLTLIFDLLMAGVFYLINWDFQDRGIMPDSRRYWGIAHELYYPIAAVIAVCAIWMLVMKRRAGYADRGTGSGRG